MGAAGFGGSFAPIVQYEKWEIHKVFPHFPYFRLGQNISPNLLAPLCGVALKKHTFFGIHDQSVDNPQGKMIGVIQGRGLDYIVDLRSESATFRQYKCLELDGNHPRLVYIAPGFGHGFPTLEDNAIQTFAMDAKFRDERSGVISYKDPEIGLSLPVEDVILSDYDADACNFNNRMISFE